MKDMKTKYLSFSKQKGLGGAADGPCIPPIAVRADMKQG